MTPAEIAITTILHRYQDALNASDTNAVMALYAPDGVFMPQNFPSSIGSTAVRKAYDAVFAAIQLTVTFKIEEVHAISPEWAFARTNSTGIVKVHADGSSSPEANQELFVFQQISGDWKIARYCFSTINPHRA
jgi:uncharacterized protein (TIGR02246 family)